MIFFLPHVPFYLVPRIVLGFVTLITFWKQCRFQSYSLRIFLKSSLTSSLLGPSILEHPPLKHVICLPQGERPNYPLVQNNKRTILLSVALVKHLDSWQKKNIPECNEPSSNLKCSQFPREWDIDSFCHSQVDICIITIFGGKSPVLVAKSFFFVISHQNV